METRIKGKQKLLLKFFKTENKKTALYFHRMHYLKIIKRLFYISKILLSNITIIITSKTTPNNFYQMLYTIIILVQTVLIILTLIKTIL